MYVDDLVEALVRVSLDRDADGQLLNIGNPEEVTILELAQLIARDIAPGTAIEHRPARAGDPQRRRPDITRITTRYGWTPAVPLAEGLRRTAAWYRAEAGRIPLSIPA